MFFIVSFQASLLFHKLVDITILQKTLQLSIDKDVYNTDIESTTHLKA